MQDKYNDPEFYAEVEKEGYNRAMRRVREEVDKFVNYKDSARGDYYLGYMMGVKAVSSHLRVWINSHMYLDPETN